MINLKSFNEILLRRRNKINIISDENEQKNIGRVLVMMKNINELGYTFSKSLVEIIANLSEEKQNEFYKELVFCLKEYTGANKKWNPMYPNFPEQVEQAEDWELFVNACIHYLSFGALIPEYEKDERLPLFESPELTVLDCAEDSELDEIMNNLISAKTSLSDTDKEDMIWLLENRGVDFKKLPDEIPFKENVAVICSLILDHTSEFEWYNALHKYLKTATDILRFITFLSGGDISLTANTKYISFTRKKRKLLLNLIDSCGNIEEDMKRYEMRWIRIGEKLHPLEYPQFKKANAVFKKLRNNEKIETFAGKIQLEYENRNTEELVALLKTRPGEFARKLDSILRNDYVENDFIIAEFKKVANQVSVPVLLQVKEYFNHRFDDKNARVFFPKGQIAKTYVIENNLNTVSSYACKRIFEICEEAIKEQFKSKESLGKVYIDDSIKGFCVPQSQRSANSSMKNVTRGSRFKLKEGSKFIRLGIHWMNEMVKGYDGKEHENRTDIDLSCSFLDKNFSHMDHISFTHLRNAYSRHSGDLTDAPRRNNGSAEFIDIDIEKAKQYGVKYAAVQIYGYTQTKFCDLDDMVFNWQEGVEANCGDIFESSRVQQSMNLGFETRCGIPVIFDIENNTVIWCDLALTSNTNFPRCVEGNVRGLSATAMGMCQSHKPQMYDIAVLNALARGEIVANRNDADVIFDQNTEKPVEIITKYIEVQDKDGNIIETRTETEEKVKDCKIITSWMTDVWQSDML